ncbi:sulfite exporter TauE/SafE family protein [Robiginitomaculum antarcticum]|uniref:sulfite exporter TauE/SafE family protein n=1 Tax=Robiginitomaculum antarcticum TaxID=437507 RepID=UPI00035EF6BF|nr:sulfite exporter TauE/SafE family protein [Robiginitomaculum antarcticum]
MEITAEIIGLAIASGAIVGLFLGIFGGGGSVLAAPLLLYVVGVSDPHMAIGTSAAAVAAIALFSLFGHWKGGRVKWPCATVFAASGLFGSILGSSLAKMIDGQTLLIGFAIAMATIGLSMFRKPKSEGDPDITITPKLILKLAPLGLIVGLAAGFFGIGGGFLIVPGLMLATGMTLSNATASSLVSVTIFGATTSANYALSGWLDYNLLGLMLLGGIFGGLVGVFIAKKLASRVNIARKGFAAMIILVAGYVGLNAI